MLEEEIHTINIWTIYRIYVMSGEKRDDSTSAIYGDK